MWLLDTLSRSRQRRSLPAGTDSRQVWQKEINVRDFIQQNYDPYEGDESFFAAATERARKLWDRLNELFGEERKKGVARHHPDPKLDHCQR